MKTIFSNLNTPDKKIIHTEESEISGDIYVVEGPYGRELLTKDSTQSVKIEKERANYWEYSVKYSQMKDGDEVLILGLGGGEIIRRVFEKFNKVSISVIELDPVIIKIYKKFFNPSYVEGKDNLKIIKGNAYDFMLKSNDKYNAIICDVYTSDGKYPSDYLEDTFLRKATDTLYPKGQFISNRIFNFRPKYKCSNYENLLKHYFKKVYYKHVADDKNHTMNYVFFASV